MLPSTTNLLRSLSFTFESAIVPAISGDFQKSLSLTTINLLRYVTECVEHEYAVTQADVEQLRTVIESIRTYLRSLPQPTAAVVQQLDKLEAGELGSSGPYLSPKQLTAVATQLKEKLDGSLKTLIALPAEIQATPAYESVRSEIRKWLADSLLREKALIDRAFISKRR